MTELLSEEQKRFKQEVRLKFARKASSYLLEHLNQVDPEPTVTIALFELVNDAVKAQVGEKHKLYARERR